MVDRLSYAESCKALQVIGALQGGDIPPIRARPPRYDDEHLGVSFFRTRLADVRLEKLTLRRTFFCRSEIQSVSFKNTDLSESVACWNDFIEVDFGSADLTQVDFRGSVFRRVNFSGAQLRGADLRRTSFEGCAFADADLTGALLVRSLVWLVRFSKLQRSMVQWHSDVGLEPEGG